mgnify:CR=1 FL=1
MCSCTATKVNISQAKLGTARSGTLGQAQGFVDADVAFQTFTVPTAAEKREFADKQKKVSRKGGA